MATVLVVDDDKDVVMLIRFVLEKDGHEIVEAHNGREALQLLGVESGETRIRPDAIVLDIMMPVLDGYRTNQELQDHESTRSIPVIVLTARGTMKDLFEKAPNIAAYVEKPFDPPHLREVLRGVLTR